MFSVAARVFAARRNRKEIRGAAKPPRDPTMCKRSTEFSMNPHAETPIPLKLAGVIGSPRASGYSAGFGMPGMLEPAACAVVYYAMYPFHPLTVHLPIGLLLGNALLTLLYLRRGDRALETSAFHCLWLGWLAGLLALASGT